MPKQMPDIDAVTERIARTKRFSSGPSWSVMYVGLRCSRLTARNGFASRETGGRYRLIFTSLTPVCCFADIGDYAPGDI